MTTFTCRIPASSANLGPGFDSMGIALGKYLTVQATPSTQWKVVFEDDFLEVLPSDASNLVIQVIQRVAKKYNASISPLKLTMASDIPLTHGLGSSASAIVAGIEIANAFAQLNLSDYDKILLATQEEGHPDNVGACITGGVFVGYYAQDELSYESLPISDDLVAIISTPPYELSTSASRSVLPAQYTKSDSINQNALNNVMLASLVAKNYVQMGRLMMQDKFHEPYRQSLIAEFVQIKETALRHGAYATVISGAGPSVLTLCSKENTTRVLNELQEKIIMQHEIIEILHCSSEDVKY